MSNKVTEKIVNQLVDELEDLTGVKFEVVDPEEKWWSGCCFDTSALMLWKMLDNFDESVMRQFNAYHQIQKNVRGGEEFINRNYYLLDNGLSRNIGRLNPSFYKIDEGTEQDVEELMNL